MNNLPTASKDGFCIFIHTYFQGLVPVVSDDDKYVIFETELEAQKEIADHAIIRIRQFLDGERGFEDAVTIEELILPVTVEDGMMTIEAGISFPLQVE